MIEIFVPYLGPSLNSIYAGIHWAKRKKHADAAHWAVKAAVVKAKLKPIKQPVALCLIPVLGKGDRRLDCSNYGYTFKLIEDGLVHAGILADDNPEHVIAVCTLAPVRRAERGVIVQIEVQEEAA